MNAAAVLERLSALGVTVTPTPRGTLYLEPANVIPPDLVELVRRNKAELLALLSTNPQPPLEGRYRRKYPGSGPPGDAELQEIKARVEQDGYILLWSTGLEDFIAFYIAGNDEARAKIPPGFTPYSDEELRLLFGATPGDELSDNALRLNHQAKKLGGGRVIGSEPDQ